MFKHIDIDTTALAVFCKRHQIAKLSLFGSVLRDDFGPDSDIDFLVEFLPGTKVSYFDLGEMTLELGQLLKTNHKVDLRTPAEISRYFRREVLQSAEPQYVAA